MRFARPNRRGMTLLEVLVAVAILLSMSLIVMESLRNSIEFNNLLSQRDETTRTARVALSKLKRDITLAYLTPQKQAVETINTVFVGLDDDPDVLHFNSLNHQRMYLNARECDQTEITVWTEDAPDERGKGYVLYHRESPRVDEEPSEEGVVYPLAYNVRSFNARFLDPQTGEWVDEWDTRTQETLYRIPRAVELAIVLIAPDPEDMDQTVDVPFLTTVVLQFAQKLVGGWGDPNDPSNPLASTATAQAGQLLPQNSKLPAFGGGTIPGNNWMTAKPTPKSNGRSGTRAGNRRTQGRKTGPPPGLRSGGPVRPPSLIPGRR